MHAFDMTPLFRTSVGFDRVPRLMDAALQTKSVGRGYPPYNIVRRSEDAYDLVLSVAGFSEEELGIETKDGSLVIKGQRSGDAVALGVLYRGIAAGDFERRFRLAAHVHVVGADLKNGLLTISLEREIPEALQTRVIPISSAGAVLEE